MNARTYRDPLAARYPRTLVEAFGPYTDSRIHEPDERICIFTAAWQWLRSLFN